MVNTNYNWTGVLYHQPPTCLVSFLIVEQNVQADDYVRFVTSNGAKVRIGLLRVTFELYSRN